MSEKYEKGYILFINLILISLIGLFIPLLIQQQQLNFRILNSRTELLKLKTAAESAVEYQLFNLREKNKLMDEEFILNKEIKINILGKEEIDFYLLKAEILADISYISEMKVDKVNHSILTKKTFRRN